MPMKYFLLVLIYFISVPLKAQKYKSVSSTVSFFSDAAIEDITATNNTTTSLFDLNTGEIAVVVRIGDFEFEKSLMKEHFNEKYMESNKYPNATFKGKVSGFEKNSTDQQHVKAVGTLTIHGQSRQTEIDGDLQIKEREIYLNSSFIVALQDYKIKIPQLLWQNIAERVEVKIELNYKAQ